jgi:hypothetical protein
VTKGALNSVAALCWRKRRREERGLVMVGDNTCDGCAALSSWFVDDRVSAPAWPQ